MPLPAAFPQGKMYILACSKYGISLSKTCQQQVLGFLQCNVSVCLVHAFCTFNLCTLHRVTYVRWVAKSYKLSELFTLPLKSVLFSVEDYHEN